MFDLITILVIAALAFPVLAVVALIKAVGVGDLVRRLEQTEWRRWNCVSRWPAS